ncbi:MAG: helix-turn-helix transcriptional regulator [Salinivirgaceae bacterium]|jgi:DNA-binding CsgD family transcriptional regulator|nr:helix-turn-helix transcriptional regulator [Salinivirgaceae bacterium]
MRDIEFSITGDGNTIMVQGGNGPRVLSKTDYHLIRHFLSIIQSRFPKSYNALHSLYAESADWQYLIVVRFIKCNWGNDDEIKDIDEDGNFNFEHVRCPLRGGLCIYEDVICHAEEKTDLTNREREVAKLIAAGKSLEEVASTLFVSIKTVETHRDNIYTKLSISRQSQLTNWVNGHNI